MRHLDITSYNMHLNISADSFNFLYIGLQKDACTYITLKYKIGNLLLNFLLYCVTIVYDLIYEFCDTNCHNILTEQIGNS